MTAEPTDRPRSSASSSSSATASPRRSASEPADLPGGAQWRAGAGAWTRALFGRYRARPWLLDIPVRGAPVTPNLLGWLEALLTVFTGSGLPEDEWLSTAILLDGYARTSASLARGLDAGPLAPCSRPR